MLEAEQLHGQLRPAMHLRHRLGRHAPGMQHLLCMQAGNLPQCERQAAGSSPLRP